MWSSRANRGGGWHCPQRPPGWADALGLAVWLVGFFFEAAGDWQLSRFKRVPANKGRLLTRGVWRYTRHPNYFGDAAVWWGHYLVAAASGAWWTVFSPALMTFLLVRVSGVSMLESALRDSKPGYRGHNRRCLFPRPPRSPRLSRTRSPNGACVGPVPNQSGAMALSPRSASTSREDARA
jgi:steroid 5-alpha reductase family enzyme